jgi:hypothetical protein
VVTPTNTRWKCRRNLLAFTFGERDSRSDRTFLVAANSQNHFCAVSAGSVAGSISDPEPFPDATAA